MADALNPRWRFSLRTLLALAVPVALCGAVYRYFGASGVFATLFVLVSLAAAALLKGTPRRAYLSSYAAAYGPFLAMALYASAFVECAHCKAAAWSMLPSGPGLVPLMFMGQVVGIPMVGELFSFSVAFAASAIGVAVLAWLLHGRRWWLQALIASVALALSSVSAYVLLALIRA
jgi:hypothetical protein